MKFISLFSGIGGFDLGFERAGMECVAQVEIDEFCGKILKKHWPDVPLWKDVRDVGKHNLPAAELVCGGFPCQDVSLAGKRAGLGGKRSTLWSEFYRIVCEIQPRWIVIENVRGLLSSDNGEFMQRILWNLSSGGYDAEWKIIPAFAFGLHQTRERVFIVAYSISRGRDKKPHTKIFGHGLSDSHGDGSRKRSWIVRRSQLLPEPELDRLVNGIPSGLDKSRTIALGNTIVPQAAEWLGKRIISFRADKPPLYIR